MFVRRVDTCGAILTQHNKRLHFVYSPTLDLVYYNITIINQLKFDQNQNNWNT